MCGRADMPQNGEKNVNSPQARIDEQNVRFIVYRIEAQACVLIELIQTLARRRLLCQKMRICAVHAAVHPKSAEADRRIRGIFGQFGSCS